VNLQVLYKLKTAKLFEKPRVKANASESSQEMNSQENDDPFAIEQVVFSPDTRHLCIAGASSHVILFRFNKQETHSDLPVSVVLMIILIIRASHDFASHITN
jgi:syntaxin-binding protein 5